MKKIGRRILDALAQRIAARVRVPAGATERSLLLLGRMLALNSRSLPAGRPLAEAEFRVFSQFGEDGIIQHLIAHVPVPSRTFVEFGVQHYVESNTRFLMLNDNWSGLVIDSSAEYVARIRADGNFWRHDLTPVCAFITRENIAELIARRFPDEELGLLSVDIDGNDYWVWEAITHVRPSIVVCEYNSVFGARLAVTVPYSKDFDRAKAHYSFLYFGASLPALCRLAERKGYAFVGSNSAGVNAFFVRKDRLGSLRALSAVEGYVASQVRESRDRSGRMNHLAGIDRLRAIADLPLLDLESGAVQPIRQFFEPELSMDR